MITSNHVDETQVTICQSIVSIYLLLKSYFFKITILCKCFKITYNFHFFDITGHVFHWLCEIFNTAIHIWHIAMWLSAKSLKFPDNTDRSRS